MRNFDTSIKLTWIKMILSDYEELFGIGLI